MPERLDLKATGGRLSGEDMCLYMKNYADSFLSKNIRYNVEVINIRRVSSDASQTDTSRWVVTIINTIGNTNSRTQDELRFDKIVLCTGVHTYSCSSIDWLIMTYFVLTKGCSQASMPKELSPTAASDGAFDGMIIHSSEFGPRLQDFLAATTPDSKENPKVVVVIGGGKSAMEFVQLLKFLI
jgi:dimethylaniline monooxygenase (N-oxide forming)